MAFQLKNSPVFNSESKPQLVLWLTPGVGLPACLETVVNSCICDCMFKFPSGFLSFESGTSCYFIACRKGCRIKNFKSYEPTNYINADSGPKMQGRSSSTLRILWLGPNESQNIVKRLAKVYDLLNGSPNTVLHQISDGIKSKAQPRSHRWWIAGITTWHLGAV